MPHQRNIDMDLLRSFVTIIETKSFTRAAVRMARTQSAISLQMKRLEEQLETRLFERGGRGVEPTEAGVMLLSYARRILAANDELVGRLVEPDVEGDVLLRAPDGFAGQHLTSVLARFRRAFPLVRLQVATTPDGAGDAEPDLVLSTGLGRAPQGADELMRETLTWCVAEGAETVQSLGDSASPLPLVLPMGGDPARAGAVAALESAGLAWVPVFEAGSRWTMQAAVAAGLGVGPLPGGGLASGPHRLTEADGLPALPDAVTWVEARDGASPAAERLRTFLVQMFDARP